MESMAEKHPDQSSSHVSAQPAVASSHPTSKTKDYALDFLEKHDVAVSFAHDEQRMRHLRTRIDFRLIPFLFLCFWLNYIDKSLLNVG